MSDRIEVGDLVMVVRWPCCGVGLGNIFTVVGVDNLRLIFCQCGSRQPDGYHCYGAGPNRKRCGAPISWLKKIDPPALPESIEHKEEVNA